MGAEALARARAYDLLGELLLTGPVGPLRAYVAKLDALAAALPPDDEAAAVEHHRVLVDEVFPYAGVFLGPAAQIGEAADAAVAAYEAAGWGVDPLGASPDHAGHALRFLAHLARAGADDHAARFLDAQLLPWLPALRIAVASQAAPFYEAVVDLALEAALSHRATLPPPARRAEAPLSAGDLAGLLDDPKTSLKRVTRRLLIPARSGLFLSAGDITRVARSVDLPRGFGSRAKMLESLVFTAIEHDALPPVIAGLAVEVARADDAWATLAGAHPEPLGAIAAAWRRKLSTTRELLERLAAAA